MQKKIYKYLEHRFSEDEKRSHAETLSKLVAEKENLDRRKKELNAQLKSEAEALETQIKKLSTEYNQGYSYENVRCTLSYDFTSEIVTLRRDDSGEVVETRPMRDDEKNQQNQLPGFEED